MRTCGTISAYNHGCRCAECRAAARTYRRRYRPLSGRYTEELCLGCGGTFAFLKKHRCEVRRAA